MPAAAREGWAPRSGGSLRLRDNQTHAQHDGGGGRSDWNSTPTARTGVAISRLSAEHQPSQRPSLPKVYQRHPIQWPPVYMSPPVPK